jgi:hypothetical protein
MCRHGRIIPRSARQIVASPQLYSRTSAAIVSPAAERSAIFFRSTKPFALGLGPLDAGLTALSDQLALELSDAAHDREHEAPHVARGVSPGVAKGANLCTSVRSKWAGAYRERRIRCISCGLAILRPVLPRCGDATGQQLAAGLRATGREAL